MNHSSLEYRILTHVTEAEDRREVQELLDQFRDEIVEETARVADAHKAIRIAAQIRRRKRSSR